MMARRTAVAWPTLSRLPGYDDDGTGGRALSIFTTDRPAGPLIILA
jgi:hypothetical protein